MANIDVRELQAILDNSMLRARNITLAFAAICISNLADTYERFAGVAMNDSAAEAFRRCAGLARADAVMVQPPSAVIPSVTWSDRDGRSGTLIPGKGVGLTEGMRFSAFITLGPRLRTGQSGGCPSPGQNSAQRTTHDADPHRDRMVYRLIPARHCPQMAVSRLVAEVDRLRAALNMTSLPTNPLGRAARSADRMSERMNPEVKAAWVASRFAFVSGDGSEGGTVPLIVQKWSGLAVCNPRVFCQFENGYAELSLINDLVDLPLADIADLIEAQL